MMNVKSMDRQDRRVAYGIAAVLVILFGVGIASCMNALNNFGDFRFSLFGNVKPIPIPAASCPYLRVLNAVEESTGEGWIGALGYNTPAEWRPFAAQLAPKLAVLETTLLVASAHVPRPVALDFTDALHQVVIGRPPLATSLTENAYVAQTNDAVVAGWGDLNHASGLIGNACGFVFSPLPND
jgi:hypothetical protein